MPWLRPAEAPQWAVESDEEQWVRREVALWVGAEAGGRGRSLDGLHALLATLLTEERQAFHAAVQAATGACVAPSLGVKVYVRLRSAAPQLPCCLGTSCLACGCIFENRKDRGLRLPIACYGGQGKQVACTLRRDGRVDPLTVLHHTGLYQQHLCRLMDTVSKFKLRNLLYLIRN